MKTIELKEVEHNKKIGQECEYIEPNVTEDCLFVSEGKVIGFYLSEMNDKAKNLVNIANTEFRSDRVPKSKMNRATTKGYDKKTGKGIYDYVSQYSTIIGSIPKKPHLRRNWNTQSSVHLKPTAKTFIKAMLLLAVESEKIVKEIMPEQYLIQKKIFENVDDKWKFGNLFTSSISNFNISAPFHRDTGNIKNTINVIITKREFSRGGCLHIPDYNATIEQKDNSILVYPAWRNVHGVTPIIPTKEGGYRNSLVFYPLQAFYDSKNDSE